MAGQINVKNGSIELLRFLFCLGILFFHEGKYLFGEPSLDEGIRLAFFPHGSIGVEFFFVVSGYLMASSIYRSRMRNSEESLDVMTLGFMKKKYMTIFPYHIIALAGTFVLDMVIRQAGITDILKYMVEIIPSVFLVQMSGISLYSPNHITWYLSVMLIAMFILYPLTYKYYSTFIKIVVPIISLILLGSFVFQDNALTGVMVWKGIALKGTIRGTIEVALGMLSFEVAKWLKNADLTKDKIFILRLLEILCYMGVFAYTLLTMTKEYEIIALFAILVGTTITFSGITHVSCFDNKAIYLLGKISLPIYLCQLMAINVGVYYLDWMEPLPRILSVTALTLILAVICQMTGDRLTRKRLA